MLRLLKIHIELLFIKLLAICTIYDIHWPGALLLSQEPRYVQHVLDNCIYVIRAFSQPLSSLLLKFFIRAEIYAKVLCYAFC